MVSADKHPKAGKKTTGKNPHGGDVCYKIIFSITCKSTRNPQDAGSEPNTSVSTSSRY
jgi:hypothetical protein